MNSTLYDQLKSKGWVVDGRKLNKSNCSECYEDTDSGFNECNKVWIDLLKELELDEEEIANLTINCKTIVGVVKHRVGKQVASALTKTNLLKRTESKGK